MVAAVTEDEKAFPAALTLIEETVVTPPKLAATALTKAVVAIRWLLSDKAAVGAVGVPVKTGLANVNPFTFV